MVPIALMKLAEEEFPRLAKNPVTRDQVWDVLELVNSQTTCADRIGVVRSELSRLAARLLGNGGAADPTLHGQDTAR